MELKVKHLEMIQDVIKRMAGNLFLLKGWSVTLVVALFAFIKTGFDISSFLFSFAIIFIFWTLDGYFLSNEKCYRALYDDVRQKEESEIDFSMDISYYRVGKNMWLRSCFSTTLVVFYGTLLVMLVAVTFIQGMDDVTVTIDFNQNVDHTTNEK